jgi:hypothetical protein
MSDLTEKIIVFRVVPQANTNTRIQFRLPGNIMQITGWYASLIADMMQNYTGFLTLNFSNGLSKPVQMQKIEQMYRMPKRHTLFNPLCESVCRNSSVTGFFRDASTIPTVNYTLTVYLKCLVNNS